MRNPEPANKLVMGGHKPRAIALRVQPSTFTDRSLLGEPLGVMIPAESPGMRYSLASLDPALGVW
jgi:hypothetical protein